MSLRKKNLLKSIRNKKMINIYEKVKLENKVLKRSLIQYRALKMEKDVYFLLEVI